MEKDTTITILEKKIEKVIQEKSIRVQYDGLTWLQVFDRHIVNIKDQKSKKGWIHRYDLFKEDFDNSKPFLSENVLKFITEKCEKIDSVISNDPPL